MTKIRRNVFETNSSSCHSITLGNLSIKEKNLKKYTSLIFQGGEFGWEYIEYNTPQDKLSYYLSALEIYMRMKQREMCAKRFVGENAYYHEYWISDDRSIANKNCGSCPLDIFQEVGADITSRIKDLVSELKSNNTSVIFRDKSGSDIEEWEFFDKLEEMYSQNAWKKNSVLDIPYSEGYIDHQSAPTESSECYNLVLMPASDIVGWIYGDGYVQGGNDNG